MNYYKFLENIESKDIFFKIGERTSGQFCYNIRLLYFKFCKKEKIDIKNEESIKKFITKYSEIIKCNKEKIKRITKILKG